jgi:multicomponent Na+:H+ antiporter subunit G
MEFIRIMIYICLAIGLAFNLLGSIALFRFPDVYTRLHGATKCTTFGTVFMTFAVIFYSIYAHSAGIGTRYIVLGVHALIALGALLLTNPTGAHAIARAAHRSGIMPKFAVVDKLAEDERGKANV